jgi:phosphonate transport system substrate-binding protein
MRKTCIVLLLVAVCAMGSVFAGGSTDGKSKPVIMVWYPNESGEDLKSSRDAIAQIIEGALGRKVEHRLTTDYNIAIEAISNKQAHIGFFGAQGYVEAHKKNPNVLPLVVNSGTSGTIKDAIYYSWLAVRSGEEAMYKAGNGYSVDNIQGKKFSWVSTSSTSGFKVPSSGIVSYFGKKPVWKDLKAENLLEGGAGKFFSDVLFGASHQGSAINLLMGKADVAAFCDTVLAPYMELASGTENSVGAVYSIRSDTAEPFLNMIGKKIVIIQSTPVLNGPFAVDTGRFTPEELSKLKAAFTSDATAKNEFIFIPKGASQKGSFSSGQRFLTVEDSFFNPIRDLSK